MEIVAKIAPLSLALIMLGLGLGLSIEDFKRVLQNPKVFIIGIISQIILLPIIAYLLILIINVPTGIALGVMIIAAAPGGVTSNVMTKFAKGDVALSISLTAVCSMISIISVPMIIFTAAKLIGVSGFSKEITMIGIALKMIGVVTLPVIIGMIIRKFAKIFIAKNIKYIDIITGILFLIVFAAIWIEERNNILSYLSQAGLIVLILNVVMIFFAYYLAKLFTFNIEQKRCIAIECGLQNGTLAVFVATQMFNEIVYIIPTAAYALIMYITAFLFMYIVRNSN